jgi:uncharacterized protein YbjT (DUF2867 family)
VICVVGASGTTGRLVVAELLARGAPVRALTRSPAHAGDLQAAGAEVVVGDLARPATLARAMRGVERVYVALPASERLPELEANAYAAAEQSGAYAVVKLGVLGAAAPLRLGRIHAEAVEALQASSLRWTVLRPSGVVQSFLRVPGPVVSARGDARVAYVDAGDVAAVAARALTEEGHEQATYELTGPAARTDAQVAAALGVELRTASAGERAAALRAAGASEWDVQALGELDELYLSGGGREVRPDVEALLGRPARSVEQVAARL